METKLNDFADFPDFEKLRIRNKVILKSREIKKIIRAKKYRQVMLSDI